MSQLRVNTIRHTGASSDAVTLASDGTCTANITNNLSNRNLIINGAMQVAQRGTSSTTNGYGSVDRFSVLSSGTDEAPTHEQVDVAAGTTPYTLGFRKALKITNGNQTGGAGADDYIQARTVLEAQDIANSGWNYLSTSSSITISFWVKSSVAQNFYGNLWTQDGTQYNYIFETGSLTENTWTKVTKTIIGNSNLQFDNDNGAGLRIQLVAFMGTNKTGSVSLNTWAAFSGSTITPDMTSTWYTTNDATFEITGVQLEVGSVATDFEHLSYGDTLAKCQRYCCVISGSSGLVMYNDIYSTDTISTWASLPVTMRITPSITQTGSGGTSSSGFSYTNLAATPTLAATHPSGIIVYRGVATSARTYIYLATSGELTMEAEL